MAMEELELTDALVGKALLTDYSLADLKKLYPVGLCLRMPNTVTDMRELAAQLEALRACGYACEAEASM